MLYPHIKTFRSSRSPWEIYQAVYSTSEVSFFLDSGDIGSPGQYSYIAHSPFLELIGTHSELILRGERSEVHPISELIPLFRRLFSRYRVNPGFTTPFFSGGAVGYFGYETAGLFEKIRFRFKPDPKTPLLYFGFYRDVIVYDHTQKVYYLVGRNRKHTQKLKSVFAGSPPNPMERFSLAQFRPEVSKKQFESMVRKAKQYIEAGDIYQANLSQRFSFKVKGDTLKLYGALRKINPSAYGSFLKIRDLEIISNSPELLIHKRGRCCETWPIAGTRPSARKDAGALKKELLANEKERAEHIMLVDLERNDLGRVCDYRSVRIRQMMGVEKYSHVMHIVSKIEGTLSKGKDAFDLIRAMFPGGTITGCPKIRCIEIIDELEPVKRGIYTGSIGTIGFSGDLDLNIVIRTLVLRRNQGHLQVGAGIVYDSDPSKEYEETLAKGEALTEALVRSSL